MDKLPFEVLVHTLSFLPPSERLNSALTCRRWAQAVSTAELLEDVWLTIHTDRQLEAAEAVLMKSHRENRNLKLWEVEPVGYNAGFWEVIGRSLRKLELDNCTCSPWVLFEILRSCSKVEFLDIRKLDFRSALFDNFRWEEIQEPFLSVRHLKTPWHLTEAAFAHLLRLLPNVTSISLTLFECSRDLVNLLPGVLGANRVITELEVEGTRIGTGDLASLISLFSASLEVLRLSYPVLSHEAYAAIGECTNLRHLTIAGTRSFLNCHMKEILLNNPGLETLELRDCESLTDEGLAPLHQLKKLRQLVFLACKSNITTEFLRSLRTISSLQDVQFQGVRFGGRVAGVGFFRSIASLPSVRTLSPTWECGDTRCLKVILHDFKNLSSLRLADCSRLTESDFAKLRQFKQLRSLSLDYADELTDEAVGEGFGSSALESLSLSRCPLTDHGLESISAHHRRLRTFDMRRCRNITAAGLTVLLERESLLQKLSITDISMTVKLFEALAEFCPQLRRLNRCGYSPVPESFETRKPAVSVLPRLPFPFWWPIDL